MLRPDAFSYMLLKIGCYKSIFGLLHFFLKWIPAVLNPVLGRSLSTTIAGHFAAPYCFLIALAIAFLVARALQSCVAMGGTLGTACDIDVSHSGEVQQNHALFPFCCSPRWPVAGVSIFCISFCPKCPAKGRLIMCSCPPPTVFLLFDQDVFPMQSCYLVLLVVERKVQRDSPKGFFRG